MHGGLAAGLVPQDLQVEPEVMGAQLRQLAAGRGRGNVLVQVLPFGAGEHPAMSGPFTILAFPEPGDRPVVTLENMASTLSLEHDDDLRQYQRAFDFLQAAALGPRESADMLATLAGQA